MITRRKFLASSVIGAAGAVVSGGAIAQRSNFIAVFDSRIAKSRMLAATTRGQKIDVAQESFKLWSNLSDVSTNATIKGSTSWGDFIAIRGQLEHDGKRLKFFEQDGELNSWIME